MQLKYTINDSAESTLNTISWIVLVLGIIGGLIILLTMSSTQVPSGDFSFKSVANPTGIVTGIGSIFVSVMWWAMMQVFINISNNLKNLNAGQTNPINPRKPAIINEDKTSSTNKTLPNDILLEKDPVVRKFLSDVYDYITSARKANVTNGTISNHIDYMVSQSKEELRRHNYVARDLVDKVYKIIENK